MARWTLVLAAAVFVTAAPANARVAPADNCADPVTYVSPDTVVVGPARPQTGQLVTYRVELDSAFVQPGTVIFTVTDPSGQQRQLQPSGADGLSITYTPAKSGTYSVEATWQGKNCNNPEHYGDGSASATHQVADPPVTPARTVRMEPSAVPGFVEQFDVKAPHSLPRSCTTATVRAPRRLDPKAAPGATNPSGVWVGYGPNASCPKMFAFHQPLSLIKTLLIDRAKHAKAGRIKVGRYSVTTINSSQFVWRQGDVTYCVEAPRVRASEVRRIIHSFR